MPLSENGLKLPFRPSAVTVLDLHLLLPLLLVKLQLASTRQAAEGAVVWKPDHGPRLCLMKTMRACDDDLQLLTAFLCANEATCCSCLDNIHLTAELLPRDTDACCGYKQQAMKELLALLWFAIVQRSPGLSSLLDVSDQQS
jgi:hypothetical protein